MVQFAIAVVLFAVGVLGLAALDRSGADGNAKLGQVAVSLITASLFGWLIFLLFATTPL